MKRKGIIALAGILVLAAFGAASALFRGGPAEKRYKTEEVVRGDLENTVTGTGTIGPVGSVEVGTQVSGTIARIFVDFNDRVREGELLAVLDTTLLSLAVRDAEAKVLQAEALHAEASTECERTAELAKSGFASDREELAARTEGETTLASLRSARTALDRARTNRDYALIRSPVDGTVIERNVEEGQTVAASLSTPTLFIIAEDLSAMRILAEVDESDIGRIRDGLEARFTVLAYPDETFIGKVTRVRLQPTTLQNVVNYTVEVSAENREGLLLPGMTATVDFVVESRKNALLAPNTALRLRPSEEMLAELGKNGEGTKAAGGRGKAGGAARAFGPASRPGAPTDAASERIRIWTLDGEGRLGASLVQTGITDGKRTEILAAGGLAEGMKVVTGTSASSADTGENRAGPGAFGPRRPF
ncbi:MAG: efflux RND transporter periplasmic adaptor subunit [Candidatus Eisenbacteria bacterium]|nr:efflux RND transporter periplasmic adaptor subunit [Candidatus Eisenbacteria bacterium]